MELLAGIVCVLAVLLPGDRLFRLVVLLLLVVIAFQLHDLSRKPPRS